MVTFKHKLTSRIIRRSFEPFRIKPLFVWKFCSSPADLIPSIQQLRDWVKGKLFIDMMIEWIRTHLFKRTVHPLIDKIFNESNWSSEGTPNSIWSYITSILAFAVFAYIYISSFSYPFLCIYAVGWNQLSLIQQTLTCLIGLTFIAIIILYYPLQFAIDVASLFYSDWFPGTHEAVEHVCFLFVFLLLFVLLCLFLVSLVFFFSSQELIIFLSLSLSCLKFLYVKAFKLY